MPDEAAKTGIEFNRAKFAFACATEAKQNSLTEYRSYAKKLPMLIKTNGLAATFAFMFSKYKTNLKQGEKQDNYIILGEDICKWLKNDPKLVAILGTIDNFQSLVGLVTTLESVPYRTVTSEVMAFLNWLRRYADGLMRKDD